MKVLYNIVHLLCYAQLLKKIILEIKVPIFATADDDMWKYRNVFNINHLKWKLTV